MSVNNVFRAYNTCFVRGTGKKLNFPFCRGKIVAFVALTGTTMQLIIVTAGVNLINF